MKTLLLILLYMLLIACEPHKVKDAFISLKHEDTIPKKIYQTNFDSSLYYFLKQIRYGKKRDSCEILYLRTYKDKYRIMGNSYLDTSHLYSDKLQRLVAKIKSQK